MKCSFAESKIPAYLDGAVSEKERQELRLHLRACRSCTDAWQRTLRVRDAIRSLPRKELPKDLAIRLRVLASRERNKHVGLGRTWWQSLAFRLNGILRPLAVPLAGGIAAAVVLFAALVPTLSHPAATSDIPCVVFTQPTLESMGPIGFTPADAIVDLRIDQTGRIVNYSIVEAAGHVDAIHRSIENSLLFTSFKPARLAPNSCSDCGVPISGTFRMVLRSSHIEVKG